MKAAFDVLGLAPDADERTIKRAYAALLKLTRPDDDPEGFQRLNDAYRQALEYARCRQEHDADTPARTQTEAPDLHEQAETRTDARAVIREENGIEEAAPSVETIAFDPEAFYARLIVLLAYCQDGELRRWLEAQPILWSLADKARLAGWLLYRLHEDEPPVPASQFDQFATYFALYDLYGGFDAFAVHALRHRLHLVWELRTPQLRALAERTRDPNTPLSAAMRETRRALRQLQRPLRWPQALFAGLLPGFPSTVRRFAYRLDRGRIDALPPPIVPAQVTFWDAAADRSRIRAPRVAIGIARCLLYAGILATAVELMPSRSAAEIIEMPAVRAMATYASASTAMLSGYFMLLGGQALRRRYLALRSHTLRDRVQLVGIPTLCLLGPWLAASPSTDIYGIAAAFAALAFSFGASPLQRLIPERVRDQYLYSAAMRLLIVAGILLPMFAELSPLPVAISYAVVAMALWAHARLRRSRR